jgi:hypothetical protein
MVARSKQLLAGAVAAATLSIALALSPAVQAQSSGPFSGMNGSWAGNGNISMQSGNKERIRCRASYQVDDSGIDARLELRCASDSYRFELTGNASFANGRVTGQWNESSRGVGGSLVGTANAGRLDLRADGQVFAALLNVTTRGNTQSITIRSPGSELQEAVISLARAR